MLKINSWPLVCAIALMGAMGSSAAIPAPETGRVLGIEHFGFGPETAVTSGDYIYVLCFQTLRVYNAGSRNRPHLVTSVPVTQSINLIANGDRLILDNGVVDISDPAAPVQVATWDWSMLGWDAAVHGDHLFRRIGWPSGSEYIAVYDLADIANPGHITDLGIASSFVISDDGVMVHQDGRRLVIRDMTDPTSPAVLGTLHLDRDFDLGCATIAGQFLYILADGLVVVDMGDPTRPVLAGTCDLNRWVERPPVIDGGRLYAGYDQTLDIFDIQDPARPTLLRTETMLIEDDPFGVRVAAVQGTVCTVREHLVSFHDCSAARSVLINSDRLWSGADLEGVVHGNAVFDLSEGWVMLTDTALPHAPSWIHRLGGRNTNAEIMGPYLTLAGRKREIFDITNAAAPVSLGFGMDLPWGQMVPTSIGAIDLWYSDGLRGWSTEGAGPPVLSWTLPIPYSTSAVEVLDDLLFVEAGGALLSYRIEDGAPTTEAGLFIRSLDDFAALSWWGDRDVLYLARGSDGLELWLCDDGVVNGTEPYLVLDDVEARSVQCSGEGLYVQNGSSGLRVYDVSDPGTPLLAADFDLCGPSDADSVLYQPLVSGHDLIVGARVGSRARIFKDLFAGVVANEPDTPDDDLVPTALVLGAAYPNPFNPSTTLSFDLPTPGRVRLTVHDARGRRVSTIFDGDQPLGRHTFTWMGRDDLGRTLPSGVYMAVLQAGDRMRSLKLTLAR